jgi:hypothetical protein
MQSLGPDGPDSKYPGKTAYNGSQEEQRGGIIEPSHTARQVL